ncbi:hypothetical protein HWD32_gp34 [Gordonia phage Secretariat]|uniref:Uncharacterized protein n=1 Tax=Gordonia phage Secretariat TaxID=2725616 RepID=A0A6M3T6Q2_9CAUD|nr:hypothetical protein HWD32_gp34 [Gordonia phage Secretariat]QJD49611.1 hypothetical protein SEA_SECRETARIAT_34 [Gordonia phage Secretariat]
METEAFDRARAFDTETIIRQNELVSEQRREIDRLRQANRELLDELNDCVRNQGDGHNARNA